jgi:hypothetical protein
VRNSTIAHSDSVLGAEKGKVKLIPLESRFLCVYYLALGSHCNTSISDKATLASKKLPSTPNGVINVSRERVSTRYSDSNDAPLTVWQRVYLRNQNDHLPRDALSAEGFYAVIQDAGAFCRSRTRSAGMGRRL